MITTITMNPALDKTIRIPTLIYGEVNRVGAFREDLGGKGINTGRIIGGFGISTYNAVILGADNSHEVLEYCKKDGMDMITQIVPGHTRTNIKVVEMEKNQTTDINEQGVGIDAENYQSFMDKVDEVASNSSYIIMGGSLAKGLPTNAYGAIAEKYKGVSKVVIDADDEVLMEGLKGSPYLIKPNIHELEEALDRTLNSEEEVIDAGREIIETYGVTYVLVSMGSKGSLLVTEDEAYRGGIIQTTIVSTVGAGDSMLAGFVYGLEQKHDLDDCLAIGTACSTITISKDGYPKLELDEVLSIAKRVPVKKL